MAKHQEHWADVRRSKSYLAGDFLPPFELQTANIIEIFEDQGWKSEPTTEEYEVWQGKILELIPLLNYDAVIELGYHLAF